jgi:site-specific DNA-cytosine methylase
VSGATPFDSPAGPTIDLFGPVPVRANLSARQAKALGLLTSGTSGRPWHHLIGECRPAVVLGEQVASKDADPWIDLVQADLEALGYAVGAVPFPSAGVGAPHIRDRATSWPTPAECAPGRPEYEHESRRRSEGPTHAAELGCDGEERVAGPTNGFWRAADWLLCRDEKWRPVEPGTFPLADGSAASLERLRAIEKRSLEEVNQYAVHSKADPGEVLRMVREVVRTEACWKEQPTRMRLELPAPSLLLDFVLCIEAACETEDTGSVPKALSETQLRLVRSVREHYRDGRSSRGLQPAEQRPEESSNPLLALSFVLARDAQAYRQAAESAHAALSRVGMLRAYGNAINAQAAAEFIRASREAIDLIA